MTIIITIETESGQVIQIVRHVTERLLQDARFPTILVKAEFDRAVSEFEPILDTWTANYFCGKAEVE